MCYNMEIIRSNNNIIAIFKSEECFLGCAILITMIGIFPEMWWIFGFLPVFVTVLAIDVHVHSLIGKNHCDTGK